MTQRHDSAVGTPTNAEIILDLLRQHTPVRFQANGPSMTPTIRGGEQVLVRPLESSELRPGAILLYRKNNRLVLHRLIKNDRRTGSLCFTGDAALDGDEAVDFSDVIGIAESVSRDGRDIPLNSACARIKGRIRYALRPMRKLLFRRHHVRHAGTPAK